MRQFTEDEIKMAEKAVEIQTGSLEYGDYYSYEGNVLVHTESAYALGQGSLFVKLPLEHQLWEMLKIDLTKPYDFTLQAFAEVLEDVKMSDLAYCQSMWQLLLAFVYHELYNKIWNGEDWISAR